jgi:hypothetical protein
MMDERWTFSQWAWWFKFVELVQTMPEGIELIVMPGQTAICPAGTDKQIAAVGQVEEHKFAVVESSHLYPLEG